MTLAAAPRDELLVSEMGNAGQAAGVWHTDPPQQKRKLPAEEQLHVGSVPAHVPPLRHGHANSLQF
jgi:hypothetical protein